MKPELPKQAKKGRVDGPWTQPNVTPSQPVARTKPDETGIVLAGALLVRPKVSPGPSPPPSRQGGAPRGGGVEGIRQPILS